MAAFGFAGCGEHSGSATAGNLIGSDDPAQRLDEFSLPSGMVDGEKYHGGIGAVDVDLRHRLASGFLDGYAGRVLVRLSYPSPDHDAAL
jgi:hypothetical protein